MRGEPTITGPSDYPDSRGRGGEPPGGGGEVPDEPFELSADQEWQPEEEPIPQPQRPRRSARARKRRGRVLRGLLVLILIAVAFGAGLFLGRALEEAPPPGGEFVRVRTLQPSTVGPQVTVTVTVTVPE